MAIVGAGLGGIGAGIRRRQAGLTSFVILERAIAVGGTLRDNTYPGCACDVPGCACDLPPRLYSFSVRAPNPGWLHSFSRQPEIWQYVEDVTGQHGLREHLLLRTEVLRTASVSPLPRRTGAEPDLHWRAATRPRAACRSSPP